MTHPRFRGDARYLQAAGWIGLGAGALPERTWPYRRIPATPPHPGHAAAPRPRRRTPATPPHPGHAAAPRPAARTDPGLFADPLRRAQAPAFHAPFLRAGRCLCQHARLPAAALILTLPSAPAPPLEPLRPGLKDADGLQPSTMIPTGVNQAANSAAWLTQSWIMPPSGHLPVPHGGFTASRSSSALTRPPKISARPHRPAGPPSPPLERTERHARAGRASCQSGPAGRQTRRDPHAGTDATPKRRSGRF